MWSRSGHAGGGGEGEAIAHRPISARSLLGSAGARSRSAPRGHWHGERICDARGRPFGEAPNGAAGSVRSRVSQSRDVHRRPRRARAQSEEYLAGNSARQDGGHHRPERLGQIDAGFRYSFRRRPAPFSRQHVALCAAVRRAARKAGCGFDRRSAADAWPSSSASRAAAANRPSRPSRRSIISCGCCSPRLGTQFCPECDVPVEKQSLARHRETGGDRGAPRTASRVLAPLVKARKGFHTEVAQWAERQGFDDAARRRRTFMPMREAFEKLERFKEHTIDVVVGETDAHACRSARRLVAARAGDRQGHGPAARCAKIALTVLSTEMSCPGCGQSFEELDPRLFSFNSPHGWCEECQRFRRNLE